MVSTSSFTDINECASYPCHPNATCTNTEGSYICNCQSGYSGNGTFCEGNQNILLIVLWVIPA